MATEMSTSAGWFVSAAINIAVPTIADAKTDVVSTDIGASIGFVPAVGDAVVAVPLAALPTDCILGGAWVSAADTVTIGFTTKEGGSGVTGANVSFKFLFLDIT